MHPSALAFPTIWKRENGETEVEYGIDRRTYIATKALAGLLVNAIGSGRPEHIAEFAVEYADALIAELNK